MRSAIFACMLGVFALWGSEAAAQNYSDSGFTTGWTTSVFGANPSTPAPTAGAIVVTGTRRVRHTYLGGQAMTAVHLNSAATYDPSQAGAISNLMSSYRIRDRVENGAVAYAPLVRQGGNYYRTSWDLTQDNWSTFSHSLSASDYSLIRPDGSLDTEQHPDFGCGGRPITFGYATGNSSPNVNQPAFETRSQLDDWAVDFNPIECTCSLAASTVSMPPPQSPSPLAGLVTSYQTSVLNQGLVECEAARIVVYLVVKSSSNQISSGEITPFLLGFLAQNPTTPNPLSGSGIISLPGIPWHYTAGGFPQGVDIVSPNNVMARPSGDLIAQPNVPLKFGDPKKSFDFVVPIFQASKLVCVIAVVNIADYHASRQSLHAALANPGSAPASASFGTGYPIWATNVNAMLAGQGVSNISCVGTDM